LKLLKPSSSPSNFLSFISPISIYISYSIINNYNINIAKINNQ
jgi:hypothetical protein